MIVNGLWLLMTTPSPPLAVPSASGSVTSIPNAIRIDPSEPTQDTPLYAIIPGHSHDVDSFHYEWRVNHKPVSFFNGNFLPVGQFKKGDAVEVLVSSMETADSPVLRASVAIRNTPPAIESLTIELVAVLPTYTIRVVAQSHDLDGDPVSYRYRWSHNGAPMAEAETDTITLTQAKRGDDVSVVVIPTDGEAEGRESVEAHSSLPNRPPQIVSTPQVGSQGSMYRYLVEATDPDGDILNYALPQAPDDARIDPDSGLFEWTRSDSFTNPVRFTIRVSDGNDGSAYQEIVLTIPSP